MVECLLVRCCDNQIILWITSSVCQNGFVIISSITTWFFWFNRILIQKWWLSVISNIFVDFCSDEDWLVETLLTLCSRPRQRNKSQNPDKKPLVWHLLTYNMQSGNIKYYLVLKYAKTMQLKIFSQLFIHMVEFFVNGSVQLYLIISSFSNQLTPSTVPWCPPSRA